jgi:8-oxo-dGTP pyrophosphatase MutT (NUDIX family)
VLVPVMAREPEATVLFTLRTAHLAAHSGQISFPGGKIEECDATPVETAIREAEEEVGIPPALVTPLSLLDLHNTGTGFRIVPVLAVVEPSRCRIRARWRSSRCRSFLMAEVNGEDQHGRAHVQFHAGIRAPLHL